MIYFIVNQTAGSGKAKNSIPMIEKFMQERTIAYTLLYTDKPDDAARIGGLIDWERAEAIVCVGGDGTVQETVGLAIGRSVKFGILPAGSANDFLYSVPGEPPKFRSFEQKISFYLEKIIRTQTISVDAVRFNDTHHLLNIGGTGIDIQVLRDALPIKKILGSAAYFISLVKNVFTYRTEEMTLSVDGVTQTGRFLLLAMCNGSYYGGHMQIAPPAKISDGLLTLCKVKKMPRLKLLALFPSVKPGRHTRFKEVSFVDCKSVKLEYSGKKLINLDGNLVEFESPLTFEILPGAVQLIV